MKRVLLLLIWLLPLVATANTADRDSLTLSERLLQRYASKPLLERIYTENVALHHLSHTTSLSSFGVQNDWRSESQALFPEVGQGQSLYQAFATAYLQQSAKDHLWGYARYTNGVKQKVSWNSTSDIQLLYPYIVSDEIGGDLKHERYSFSGGYSGLLNALRLSGELSYAAQQEYRNKDPRPRNITSHLQVTVGSTYPLGDQVVGATLSYGIYKQRSSVSFYNPSGATVQRLMNGLGGSFVRFDTNDPTLYYRLYSVGGSLHTMPLQGSSGLFAEGSYRYAHLTQILSDLNEVPTQHYKAHQASASVGYQLQPVAEGLIYSAQLRSEIELRDGIEHIVSEPKAGTYPIVGYLHNLRMLHNQNSLGVTISQKASINWYGRATFSHQYLSVVKLEPEKRLLQQRFTTALAGGVAYALTPQQTVTMDTEVAYSPRIRGTLKLPLASMRESQIAHLQHLSDVASSSTISLCVGGSYGYAFGSGANEWGLQLSCLYQYGHFQLSHESGIHQHQLQTTLKLIF